MSAAWRERRIGLTDLMRASIAVPSPAMARPGDILVGPDASGGHEPHVGVVVGLIEPEPDGLLPAGLRDAEARRRIRVVSIAPQSGARPGSVWGDDYGSGGDLPASGGFALGAREAGKPSRGALPAQADIDPPRSPRRPALNSRSAPRHYRTSRASPTKAARSR